MRKRTALLMLVTALMTCLIAGNVVAEDRPILKIGYSDWPGWVAWEIGIQKGWFNEAGVDARFFWYDYLASMETFSSGKLDAVCMTDVDALVTGASGKHSKGIMINDYSNGADMVVAKAGIESVKDLAGKKVALEVGLLEELLLQKALEKNGMQESDVTVVNFPTDKLPLALKVGQADAIVAWQPSSGEALKVSPGAKAIFTSADVPGLIYDMLFVDDESLKAHPDEWKKVVQVWFRIADYIKDPANKQEVLQIMSKRTGTTPKEYESMITGAFFLDLAGNQKAYQEGEGLDSVYGSMKIADQFNVASKAYDSPQDVKSYIYPEFVVSPQ